MAERAKRSTKGADSKAEQKSKTASSQKGSKEKSGLSFNADILKDQIDMVKGLAGTTSEVVQKAASILEEEIAAGIVAAKKVEEQFINVKEMRSEISGDVIPRFRKDAHDIIDILIDLVNAAAKSLDGFTQQIVSINGGTGNPKPNPSGGTIPTLNLPKSVKAGASANVPMTLQNDSNKTTEKFEFFITDLVNGEGGRISARQISFKPASLTIEPQKTEKVVVSISVPKTTKPGVYSGLIQATRLDQLQAVLAIKVE